MTILTPLHERREILKDFGVPVDLITALADANLPPALAGLIQNPDSAYWNYARHPSLFVRYAASKVIPVAEGTNGDVYYDLVIGEAGHTFTVNQLEGDWREIGPAFESVAAELAEQSYELNDALPVSEIAQQFELLGIPSVGETLARLEFENANK